MRIKNTVKLAVTNTLSASRNPSDTMTKPVGLRKFTPYLYQYTTAGTQQL